MMQTTYRSQKTDDHTSPKLPLALVLLIPSEPPEYAGNLVASLIGSFPDMRVIYRRLDQRPLWITTTPPKEVEP